MRTTSPAPNHALADRIKEARCSYDALAATVRVVAKENRETDRSTRASISHWLSGMQPRDRTAEYLREALSRHTRRRLTLADIGLTSPEEGSFDQEQAMGDPVDAIARLGRADVNRRTMITYSLGALLLPLDQTAEHAAQAHRAARGTSMVGAGEVQAVKDMTAAFTAADERIGGAHARSAVAEYLTTDVATYLNSRFATDEVRRQMYGAAAQVAYLAGWKAHDLGLAGLAQRYYLHAHSLAQVADPYAHTAYTLRILAHQAIDLGLSQHCLDLADEALRLVRGRVDPAIESLFVLTQARAHAADKSPRRAAGALHRAEVLIGRDREDQRPSWVALGGPAEARLAHQAGKTLQACGDLPAAEEQLTRSASAWDPATHPRVYALTMADLAETQCRGGHLDAACTTWTNALDAMAGVHSARTTNALRSLRAHLAPYRRRGAPAAQRLDAKAAQMIQSAR
ncbi:hypothetical protein [Actinoplanes sp. HUAS TT8]|uniref:hypothetical protein n=1 Tax=Actinoplanes sp. HUAS TT8 TaxID=3447453 RepID=UPI003F523DD1